MKYKFVDLIRIYWRTIKRVRMSLLTIVIMLALGYLTRHSGLDATLGLAFAATGFLYPLFGTLPGAGRGATSRPGPAGGSTYHRPSTRSPPLTG